MVTDCAAWLAISMALVVGAIYTLLPPVFGVSL